MTTTTLEAPLASARRASTEKRRERRFFSGMTIVIVLTVFAGFARTYYLRPYFQTTNLSPLLHLHGVVFSSWLVLLVAQTLLVASGRTALHRRLGIAGGVVAGLVLIVGSLTAIVRAKIIELPPGAAEPLVFLTVPLGDMVLFAGLAGFGFYYRRVPAAHKRLMLLATIAILPAAVARLPLPFIQELGPIAFFGLTDLFIVAIAVYDVMSRGRVHAATLVGGLFLVVSHPLRLVIGSTAWWLAFATWLTSWVE